jgi:hypothetical protein
MSAETAPAADLAAIEDLVEEKVEQRVKEIVDERVQKETADLRERLKAVEEENRHLRDRVDELENEPSVEFRGESAEDPDKTEMEDLWVGGLPIGFGIEERKEQAKELDERLWDVDERLSALERGELDPSDIIDLDGSTNDLEIQRATAARKSGNHSLSENEYRATFIWPKFHQHAQSSNGQLVLASWQVQNFLEENDLNTNPNTVRRVMKMLAKMTSEKEKDEREPDDEDNLVTFSSGSSENTLRADKDEWLEFFEDQMDAAVQNTERDAESESSDVADEDEDHGVKDESDDVLAETERLSAAEAVTTSSEDSVEGEIGGREVGR